MAQSSIRTIPEVAEKIKVFPNPATSVINILGLQNSNEAFIRVSDIFGNTVLQHQWTIKNNALNIPVSALKKGMYVITIHSNEHTIQTKFYKQ